MKNIILASASPRRRELLTQIGIDFEVKVSTVEEVITSSIPEEIVKELSRQKAVDVAEKVQAESGMDSGEYADPYACSAGLPIENELQADIVVIGADTVVSSEGRVLGKPHTEEEAFAMIKGLQGRAHEVYTGVTLAGWTKGCLKTITFAEKTKVYVSPMADQEIHRYIATGEPMDKAGAYGIQGAFAAFVEKIEGSYANVVGLPVARVYQELKKM